MLAASIGLYIAPDCYKKIGREECPLWVISGHTDKSAPCPLYPQERTLGGTSKFAFGCRFMSTRPSCRCRRSPRKDPLDQISQGGCDPV